MNPRGGKVQSSERRVYERAGRCERRNGLDGRPYSRGEGINLLLGIRLEVVADRRKTGKAERRQGRK